MRLAILNHADVVNFGDILFPVIAEAELRRRLPDASIDFFSATDFTRGSFHSARYDRRVLAGYHAILLCGGEIIHREDRMLAGIFGRVGGESIPRPTDLVYEWADLPVPFKAWIGIGMPPPSPEVVADVGRATSHLDLIIARGEGTRRRLLASGAPASRVELAPDLGWLIPRLAADRAQPIEGLAPAHPYIVVHALPQPGCPGLLDSAVRILKEVRERHGVRILGLPLTTCWADETELERLGDLGGGAFQIADYRLDVFTKARLLGASLCGIGQSMHGFVATLAAGRPAGLVYPNGDDKFRELLASLDAPDWRVDDFSDLSVLIERVLRVPPGDVLVRSTTAIALVDRMFDRVAQRIRSACGVPMDA